MEKMKSLFEFVDFLKSIENPLIEKRPLIEELEAHNKRRIEIDCLACTPIEAAEYKKFGNAIDTKYAEIALYDVIFDKSKHFHVNVPMIYSELERFYETATEKQKNNLSNEILNDIDKYRDFKKNTGGLLYISLPRNLEEVLEYLYKLYDKSGLGWLEERPRIVIPQTILDLLAETKCENGKPFIIDAQSRPIKWIQNKIYLRILLEDEKINLSKMRVCDIERQVPCLFIDEKGSRFKLPKYTKTLPKFPNLTDTGTIRPPNRKKLNEILATLVNY